MKLKLQSLWNRAGKLEKAFALLLVLYLILRAAWPDSGLETLVAFATYVIGAWLALRLLRIGLRKLTWRLRNRLMVAYLFIAVLPILLILTLVGLGGYMLATRWRCIWCDRNWTGAWRRLNLQPRYWPHRERRIPMPF